MTDHEKPENKPQAEDAAPAPAENATPDPFAVVEKLNQETTELKDKVLRTLAEMENLRRRTEREVSDARTYGVTKFARDMLEFADNIHRALANVPADARASEGPLKTLVDGIEVIERNFVTTLGRHGIKRLEPQGQKFDPNMHEALFEIPNPSVPSGTVAQVVEAGYAIGDRVLRPAKVGVARGGPKAAPAEEAKASGDA
ncbi:nucleotide exchange factor GrpE [Methylovirgula sp. 4M-Z18]|uniref:nucleotide exchange factor GrpE n=1 Tax=Methylovirgula sp. 4M-Z18 TaxID=2293567 RepID=UPI000E2EA2B4|nr:nucleotide exchange factor GrpE [Methylovirgula sp. 4M-Z18]RFB79488.1 nucleotide exchange factor GrpE [Methylovirgula sp. 4M-Z18]